MIYFAYVNIIASVILESSSNFVDEKLNKSSKNFIGHFQVCHLQFRSQ